MFDWLVVGAGFAGSVLAERLASVRGDKVLVIDRRDHIAGNAYDHPDDAGVLIHRYGPHIFHTNSEAIFQHLSRFTEWRQYEHRVLAQVKSPTTGEDTLVPIPINLDTINKLYGLNLTEEQVEGWMAERAEQVPEVRTSEDVVVGKVGRELYELFFRGYTRKQWALDPSELDKSVTSRVPTRTNRDDRYFTDRFQYMPRDGYTAMFRKMLDHPNITVRTGMEFAEARKRFSFRRMIWTGPVDEYFGFRFGKLPYRSLKFRHETLDKEWALPTGTVNHPAEGTPFTRVSEYKWMTGQEHPKTSVTYELPSAEGDPYYPIPRPENAALYKKYEALADAEQETWFVGRLATYRYYNMDQVVGQALSTFERIQKVVPPEAANDDRDAAAVAAGE
jgi:UDP-galactopyranose mutase